MKKLHKFKMVSHVLDHPVLSLIIYFDIGPMYFELDESMQCFSNHILLPIIVPFSAVNRVI